MKHFTYLWIILLCPISLHAQKVFSPYPFHFDHLFNLTTLYNPAFEARNKTDFIQIGYNDFNPLSNTIASYYVNGRISLGKNAVRPHRLGLFLINDKEGIYLGRFKMMIQYNYALELSPEIKWRNGIGLGLVNHVLKPNDAIPGESVFSYDLDIGSCLEYKESYIGISTNQFLNENVVFLSGSFTRYRYYALLAGQQIRLSPTVNLQIDFYGRTGKIPYNKYTLGILSQFQRYMIAGATFKYANGIIPIIGVRDIPVNKNRFGLMFSYAIPTSKVILSGSGNFELQLEYIFR